jgi:methyl-accepting chemotaxis protein
LYFLFPLSFVQARRLVSNRRFLVTSGLNHSLQENRESRLHEGEGIGYCLYKLLFHTKTRVSDNSIQNIDDSIHDIDDSIHNIDDSIHDIDDSIHDIDDSIHNIDDSIHNIDNSIYNIDESIQDIDESI